MDRAAIALRSIALAFTLAAVPASVSHGRGVLMAYDGFGGPPLADLAGSAGGTGWAGPLVDQADTLTGIAGAGLTYPGLVTTPGGAVSEVGSGVYPQSVYGRAFGQVPAGGDRVYISFLMRADAGYGVGGGLSFGTYPFAMFVGSPLGMYRFGLMVSEGLGDISNAPLVQGETNLVVLRISKNTPAAGVTYKLYLNPVIGQPEPSFALAQFGLAQVGSLPSALSINNGGGFTTDEIRVGTSWAAVLPAPPVCVGDLSHDGSVNGADLGILLGAWGGTGGDLNGDGSTDGADLGMLLGAWGPCP